MTRVMKSFIAHADRPDHAHGGIPVPDLELFCKDRVLSFYETGDKEPRNLFRSYYHHNATQQ